MTDRIVALVDMDCFYCQVESRLNPSLQGKPMAVVQYNAWKGGGIIAVNYEARARGVTRFMRGDDAKLKCPEIELVQVPTLREKADLTKYRDAGREVVAVFCTFSDCVERASIDEAYIDLTLAVEERLKQQHSIRLHDLPNTFVVGYSQLNSNNEDERIQGVETWLEDVYGGDLFDSTTVRLATAGVIVEEMRAAVYERTGFRCSAGIAHNKILAKLSCGLHKPNRQTILPLASVPELYSTLPLKKVRSLGGKFGEDITEKLGCVTMSDMARYTEKELQLKYDEKTGTWLYNIARGFDYEPVTPRLISKSIGCCKRFPGRTALVSATDVQQWLGKLVEELVERLLEDQEMNKRKATMLTISIHMGLKRSDNSSSSRSIPLPSYDTEKIFPLAYMLIKRMANVTCDKNWTIAITFLGLSAGKFSETNSTNSISHFFKTSLLPDPLDNCVRHAASNEGKQEAELKLESNDENKLSEMNSESKVAIGKSFFQKFLQQNSDTVRGKLNIIPKIGNDFLLQDSDSSSNKNDMFEEQVSSICKSKENLPPISRQADNIEEALPITKLATKKETGIKSFLNCGRVNNSKCAPESNNGTIYKYFKNKTSEKWIDPHEIFPDLGCVDEDLISSLPMAFRKKMLSLKELQSDLRPQDSIDDSGCSKNPVDSEKNLLRCDEFLLQRSEPIRKEWTNIVEVVPESCLSNKNIIASREDASLEKECPECNVVVPLFQFEEHNDLHLAERLDHEWNHRASTQNPIVTGAKRKNNKKLGDSKNKKFKKIESFFSRKVTN